MGTMTQHNFGSAAYQHSTMSQVIKQLNEQDNAIGSPKQRHFHTGMNTNVGALILLMAMMTILMAGQGMNSVQQQLKVAENQQNKLNEQLEDIAQTELPQAMNLSSANMATVDTFQEQISRVQSGIEDLGNNVQQQAMLTEELNEAEKTAYNIGKQANDIQTQLAGTQYQTAYRKGQAAPAA